MRPGGMPQPCDTVRCVRSLGRLDGPVVSHVCRHSGCLSLALAVLINMASVVVNSRKQVFCVHVVVFLGSSKSGGCGTQTLHNATTAGLAETVMLPVTAPKHRKVTSNAFSINRAFRAQQPLRNRQSEQLFWRRTNLLRIRPLLPCSINGGDLDF